MRTLQISLAAFGLLLALAFSLSASAQTYPTYRGYIIPVGASPGTCLQTTSGGAIASGNQCFSYDGGPNPASGSTFYFAGDSITFGLGINNQATFGCAHYTYPSPCWVDQVTSHYSAILGANYGGVGACLETTSTALSICNPAFSGIPSLITNYTTTILPHAGANNNWFFIMIGTNDVSQSVLVPDPQVTVANFKANYSTVVAALEAAGTPGNQIVLGEIPFQQMSGLQSNQSFVVAAKIGNFNAAIADVSAQYHTRLATTFRAMAQCNVDINFSNLCMFDSAHPNNTGHANLAVEFEQAAAFNAIAAKAQDFPGGVFGNLNIVVNPYTGTFQANTLVVTSHSGSSLFAPNAYGSLNVGTNATGLSGNAVWLTSGTLGVAGVLAQCFGVLGQSILDFSVDCGSNGSGEGNVGILGEARVDKSVAAGYLLANMPTYAAGSLVSHVSSGCGKVVMGSINPGNSGTLDYGCTTAGIMTSSATVAAPHFSGAGDLLTGIPNSALSNSTISGTALGGTLPTLSFGPHLSAVDSSYNGAAAKTIQSDATSANTASTIVARDASGNFSATTITAALIGNANTATSATNTGITDDTTTNATMYPTWVTTTTGNLPQKVSSTKLTFNPSTGRLSPTGLTTTSDVTAGGGLYSAGANGNVTTGQISFTTDGTDVFLSAFSASAQYKFRNNTNVIMMQLDGTGHFGTRALAAATGNTLCYDTTSITNMNTLATCSSLRELKKDIAALAFGSSLADIMALRPVSFTDRKSGEHRYGFIAQDVESVDPVLSSYYRGNLNGVDYNGIVSKLTATVQGQQRQITRLECYINALSKHVSTEPCDSLPQTH